LKLQVSKEYVILINMPSCIIQCAKKSLSGLDLTKGSTRFVYTIDLQNMGLTWDPMKTPNNYHISLMVYFKKLQLGIIEQK
jgi:hypothetical protein